MLGGDFNSRFTARVRQKEGLSYGINSGLSADVFDKSGSFNVFAIAAPENIAKVETAVKEELARALKDGFTADEVKIAKQGWLQSREVTRTEDFSIASSLRAYLYQGRTFTWDADLERKVQALTADQIVAALRRHIDPAKLTIMKAGDFAKKK